FLMPPTPLEDPDIHFNPKGAYSSLIKVLRYQNLATNKVTLFQSLIISFGLGSAFHITASSDYTDTGADLILQLTCCQIEDGQCHTSFLNITKELAANKYKHISARTIYFQWLPKNPQTLIVGNTKISAMMFFLCVLALLKIKAAYANPIDGIDGSIHITTKTVNILLMKMAAAT
ncbi:hypothetical protein ACJX0J_024635, partial [Zea mays]